MPFSPIFTVYAGMLPIMEAAKTILEDDFLDALTWRCALDGSTVGADFARIQFSQMHSQKFPLCVIQPAQSIPANPGTGYIQQRHIFGVEIYCTRAISSGSQTDGANELTKDLCRYLDAVEMAFLSATGAQWTANLPTDHNVDAVRPFCTNFVFGQLTAGSARETAGQYLRSAAFELQVSLMEGEN